MHLRIPRDIHAECAEEADRLGMSITAIMLERLSATSSQKTKTELTRLVSEVAGYGEPVLRPALEALWSTDETHRMRCIRDALHAARDVREA